MSWMVTRTDDNGVEQVMARNLSEDEARTLVDRMALRGHKQSYQMLLQIPVDGTHQEC
jgi:hypothetical protein